MRFTPVLIVYCIIMFIAAIAVRQLNKCSTELKQHRQEKSHE